MKTVKNSNSSIRNLKKRTDVNRHVFSKLLKSLCLIALLMTSVLGQQTKSNENKADMSLKSSARVNPSTLAMEMTIPIGGYPGRSGNSIPISINYSSKNWTLLPPEFARNEIPTSTLYPRINNISKSKLAFQSGWRSSLNVPIIKEDLIVFDEIGLQDPPISNAILDLLRLSNSYNSLLPPITAGYESQGRFLWCCGFGQCWGDKDFQQNPESSPFSELPNSINQGVRSISQSDIGADPDFLPVPVPDRFYVKRVMIEMPDGSTHEFRKDDKLCNFKNENCFADTDGTYLSVDGSKMRFEKNEVQPNNQKRNVLYMPDGSRYIFPINSTDSDKYVDADGNFLLYDNQQHSVTDTLGRTIGNPLAGGTYQLPGLNGTNRQFQFVWKNLKASGCETSTNAGCGESILEDPAQALYYESADDCNNQTVNTFTPSLFHGTADLGAENTYDHICSATSGTIFNPALLAEVILPNGTKYSFKYNRFGEITKITYPTGGYERFRYDTVVPVGANLAFPQSQVNRGVVERWTSVDGTNEEQHWSYELGKNGSYGTAVTYAPDGTKEESNLHIALTSEYGLEDTRSGMPYDVRVYSKPAQAGNEQSRTLLRRNLTEWIVTGPIGTGSSQFATRDPRVTKEISITIENGQALAQMVETEYDTNADLSYFASLNPKRIKTYDYVTLDMNTAATGTIAQIAALFGQAQLDKIAETDYSYDANYKNRGIIGLPTATRLKDKNGNLIAQTETRYDESAYPIISAGTATGWADPNSSLRGNATTARLWSSSDNTWLETHAQFDNFGNARKAWDAKGNVSEVEFSSAYSYAYPTKTISAVPDPTGQNGSSTAFESTTVYDAVTGLVLSTTDANGQTAAMEYNDPLLRPTKVVPPAGGAQTITEYGDTVGNLYVKTKSQIDATNWAESTAYFDGMGRTVKSQKKDSQGDVFAETEYDNLGRVKRVTNPYRSGETKQWTTSNYDDLGRVKEVVAPDGTSVTSEYGISTTANFVGTYVVGTDQAGKKGRSITNGLGQLVRVDEPDDNNNLGTLANPTQATYYNYDALGKMVKVQQGAQARYFKYDGLGRLIRVRQPEQGVNANLAMADAATGNNDWSAGFTYDANGNLLTATDTKGTVITSVYDNLNRVISRSYSDSTPAVSYTYDDPNIQYSKGRLMKTSNSVSSSQILSLDNLGRVLSGRQTTDNLNYDSAYSYNLSGALIEETYPSGRKVKNSFATDGNLSKIETRGSNNAYQTRANNFAYSPSGAISQLQIGNGLWETAQFNNRLQVTQLGLGTSATDTSLWKLDYDFVGTSVNDGNIKAQTVTSPAGTFVQTFQYDALDRLKTAQESSGGNQVWIQNFQYDRYGNRTGFNQTINGQTTSQTPTVDPNTNRFTAGQGYTYDLAGNVIQDAQGRSFTFNGDNKQVEVKDANNNTIGQYLYDGDGKRIKKVTPQETTTFVYSGGKLVAEYTNSTATQQSPTTQYLGTDMLGSPRVITDQNAQVISRRDFMPFGEDLTRANYGTDKIRQKFTGYQKDDETGLDFAEARYYNNQNGRFTAVDPLLASGKSANPQSFNRYSYTFNNPLILTDPSGMQVGGHLEPCQAGNQCVGSVSRNGGRTRVNFFNPIASVEIAAASSQLITTTSTEVTSTVALRSLEVLPELGVSASGVAGGIAAGGAALNSYLLLERIQAYEPGGIYDNTINRVQYRNGEPTISSIGSTNTLPDAIYFNPPNPQRQPTSTGTPMLPIPGNPDSDKPNYIVVYRGLNGTNPGAFRFNPDLSTSESQKPGYKYQMPFTVMYRGEKQRWVTGVVVDPIFGVSVTATFTPSRNDPGHWSIYFPGTPNEQASRMLADKAKELFRNK